jgi:hypothetical protein
VTGWRRTAAWVVFVLVAVWSGYRLLLIVSQASTSLYFMSVAGRADAVISAMVAAAFGVAMAMTLALWAGWKGLRTHRVRLFTLGVGAALLLPLLHIQIIAGLASLASS